MLINLKAYYKFCYKAICEFGKNEKRNGRSYSKCKQ